MDRRVDFTRVRGRSGRARDVASDVTGAKVSICLFFGLFFGDDETKSTTTPRGDPLSLFVRSS